LSLVRMPGHSGHPSLSVSYATSMEMNKSHNSKERNHALP
jgi:hypothetical protein